MWRTRRNLNIAYAQHYPKTRRRVNYPAKPDLTYRAEGAILSTVT